MVFCQNLSDYGREAIKSICWNMAAILVPNNSLSVIREAKKRYRLVFVVSSGLYILFEDTLKWPL